jgi:LacI family transcriptional regulator
MAAFGVLARFYGLGVAVPGDFSVVGYDNVRAASLPQIALTTVDQSGIEMGSIATRLLVERIEGRSESVSTLVAPKLVIRGTSAPPRS